MPAVCSRRRARGQAIQFMRTEISDSIVFQATLPVKPPLWPAAGMTRAATQGATCASNPAIKKSPCRISSRFTALDSTVEPAYTDISELLTNKLAEIMELTNKACLITGGTSGIGAATAIELARRGANIAITGLEVDPTACAVKASIESAGARCHLTALDISVPATAASWVERAAHALGGVDVLIHCAGTLVPGGLLEVSEVGWYSAFDLHVHAVFHLCRAAVPRMRTRGEGAIILISSAAGARGCLGAVAYGVAKGAIPQFVRLLAREVADDNIRVNCVSPGIIRTPFQNYLTPEQVRNNIENRIPLHREGRPEDVAQAIVALVMNDFITGENLGVDGGMTMRIA